MPSTRRSYIIVLVSFALRARNFWPIDQRKEVEAFFLVRNTFHLREGQREREREREKRRGIELTISAKPVATRRGNPVGWSTELTQVRGGARYAGVADGSEVAATLGATECRSMARGTRNIRFRNELTLRPSNDPPSCGIPPRDGDR